MPEKPVLDGQKTGFCCGEMKDDMPYDERFSEQLAKVIKIFPASNYIVNVKQTLGMEDRHQECMEAGF
jgi:hypothetical protein